jgi:hypothetical protein
VQLGPVRRREAHIGQHVGLDLVHERGELGALGPELIGDLTPLRPGGFGVFLSEGSGDEGRDNAAALTIFVGEGGGKTSWLQATISRALTTVGIPTDGLGILLLIALAAITAKNLLLAWSSNFVGYEVAEVAMGLRLKLIDALLRVRWSYFTHRPVGRFANAMSSEAARASEAYSASAGRCCPAASASASRWRGR